MSKSVDAAGLASIGARRLSEMRFLVVDTETTGSDSHARVWSIGAIALTGLRWPAEHEYFRAFYSPAGGLPARLCRKFGWTQDLVRGHRPAGLPSSYTPFHEFASAFRPDFIVGHNVGFDLRMIEQSSGRSVLDRRSAGPKATILDTLPLARSACRHLMSHKLGDVCSSYGVNFGEGKAHDAYFDAMACALMLPALLGHILDGQIRSPYCPTCGQRHSVTVGAGSTPHFHCTNTSAVPTASGKE